MADPDMVPRLARPFVAALLAMMVASALFVWEPWPFTSFRLFSHLRYDEQSAWSATAVDARGRVVDYPLDSLDRGLRGFNFAMTEFVDAAYERRDELCRAWVAAAPDALGRTVREVRIYRRHFRLSDRRGDRADRGTVEHAYTCTGIGATVAGG